MFFVRDAISCPCQWSFICQAYSRIKPSWWCQFQQFLHIWSFLLWFMLLTPQPIDRGVCWRIWYPPMPCGVAVQPLRPSHHVPLGSAWYDERLLGSWRLVVVHWNRHFQFYSDRGRKINLRWTSLSRSNVPFDGSVQCWYWAADLPQWTDPRTRLRWYLRWIWLLGHPPLPLGECSRWSDGAGTASTRYYFAQYQAK